MNIQDLLLEWAKAEPEICQYAGDNSFVTVHGEKARATDTGEVFDLLRLAMKKKRWLWTISGDRSACSASVWDKTGKCFYSSSGDPVKVLLESYLKAVLDNGLCPACKRRKGADTLDCIKCGKKPQKVAA